MRTIETRIYKFNELNDDAKEKARDWLRECNTYDSFYTDEIVDSLKALFEHSGIRLTNWSLGAYNQNNYVRFDMGEAGGLKGKRAFAWLENNLFSRLRISRKTWLEKKKEYMSYGEAYREGKVKPGPLTGICYDEDFLSALVKEVKEGATLSEAYKRMANVCGDLMEKEEEYRNSDEAIDEDMEANEYEFTEEGLAI